MKRGTSFPNLYIHFNIWFLKVMTNQTWQLRETSNTYRRVSVQNLKTFNKEIKLYLVLNISIRGLQILERFLLFS